MKNEKRVVADCRQIPSEKNCTVTIAGTEEEVFKLALRHAIEDHGHTDSAELREMIRSSIKNEEAEAAH